MQLTDPQRRAVAALTRAMMGRLNGVSDNQRALAEELSAPPTAASAIHPDPAVVSPNPTLNPHANPIHAFTPGRTTDRGAQRTIHRSVRDPPRPRRGGAGTLVRTLT